jgi:hypothetical protein
LQETPHKDAVDDPVFETLVRDFIEFAETVTLAVVLLAQPVQFAVDEERQRRLFDGGGLHRNGLDAGDDKGLTSASYGSGE